jgi:hypothetical protein
LKPTPSDRVERSFPTGDRADAPVYRLLVRVGRRDVVFDAPPFSRYKQAMSQVATAVRRHAHRGRVQAVVLQRGELRNGQDHSAAGRHPPADRTAERHWTDVMSWDGAVVARILRQANHTADRPSRVPDAGLALPRLPSARPRRHRWPLVATALVLLATWVSLVLLVTDGHPTRLLDRLKASSPALVTELPFDAPRGTGGGDARAGPSRAAERQADIRTGPRPVP